MRLVHRRGDCALPVRVHHARPALLERQVAATYQRLTQIVEAVLGVRHPILPVQKYLADLVQALNLVPHGDAEWERVLAEVDVAAVGRAQRVPLRPRAVARHGVVLLVVVERHVHAAQLERELARMVVAEIRYGAHAHGGT